MDFLGRYLGPTKGPYLGRHLGTYLDYGIPKYYLWDYLASI
jgi:hypothetical protein